MLNENGKNVLRGQFFNALISPNFEILLRKYAMKKCIYSIGEYLHRKISLFTSAKKCCRDTLLTLFIHCAYTIIIKFLLQYQIVYLVSSSCLVHSNACIVWIIYLYGSLRPEGCSGNILIFVKTIDT